MLMGAPLCLNNNESAWSNRYMVDISGSQHKVTHDAPAAIQEDAQLPCCSLLRQSTNLRIRGPGFDHDLIPDEPTYSSEPGTGNELSAPLREEEANGAACQQERGLQQ